MSEIFAPLDHINEVPEYYRTWLKGSELIAILPARHKDDSKSMTCYSVESLEGNQLSPVFLFRDSFNDPLETKDHIQGFLFDSEWNKMYTYENGIFTRKDTYKETVEMIKNNPIVIFFMGCDDSHVGLRFETEEKAFSYLESLGFFEDVFDLPTGVLQYHN